MTRYIITGGCGFVGRNLVHGLLDRGESPSNIKVIDNLSVGTADDLRMVCGNVAVVRDGWSRGGISLAAADIRDADAMKLQVSDADVVVHLAACTGVVPAMKDPVFDCDTNVRGTLNLLEACRANGIRRFIFASSGAPLGMVTPPIHENLPARPMSPYGASKLAGEGYCSAYYHAFGIDAVALRFGNLFGPFSSHKISVVAAFISRALAGLPLELHGGGNATRDFIYTKDLVEAIILAVHTRGIGGETFQISTGKELSIKELFQRMEGIFRDAGVAHVRASQAPARPVDIPRSFADSSKARRILNWQPRYTLEQGLAETLQWFLGRQPAGTAGSADPPVRAAQGRERELASRPHI